MVKDTARERIRRNPCGRYGTGQDPAGHQSALVGTGECQGRRAGVAPFPYRMSGVARLQLAERDQPFCTADQDDARDRTRHRAPEDCQTHEGRGSADYVLRSVKTRRGVVPRYGVCDSGNRRGAVYQEPWNPGGKRRQADYCGFQAGADRNADREPAERTVEHF